MYRLNGYDVWCKAVAEPNGEEKMYTYTQAGSATILSKSSKKFPFSHFKDTRDRLYYGVKIAPVVHCNVIYMGEVFRLIDLSMVATIRSHNGKEEFKVSKSQLMYAVEVDS
jgi:hypothetical protein